MLTINATLYRTVRGDSHRFLVKAGHEIAEAETLVEQHGESWSSSRSCRGKRDSWPKEPIRALTRPTRPGPPEAVCRERPEGIPRAQPSQREDAMTDQQRTQQPNQEDQELDDPQDDSILDKAKDKLSDLVDAPEAAEHDQGKTNPVTRQRRD